MNDDVNPEPELTRILPAPDATPPGLRSLVLSRVTAELERQRRWRTGRRAMGAACLLLAGVLANVGVLYQESQWSRAQDRLGSVPQATEETFRMVALVTDNETAERLRDRLLAARQRRGRDREELTRRYTSGVRELTEELAGW